jgi:hypothetical protein
MSWQPKRFDPPGHQDDDEPHRCPKCSWASWETFVWLSVGTVAFYVVVILLFYRASR